MLRKHDLLDSVEVIVYMLTDRNFKVMETQSPESETFAASKTSCLYYKWNDSNIYDCWKC